MFRIDGPGATDENKFTEGNPASGTRATVVSADWLNAVQEELAYIIEQAGDQLDKDDPTQVYQALMSIIATSRTLAVPSLGDLRLADLPDGPLIALILDDAASITGWGWDPASTADDDGENHVKPDSLTSLQPGRWRRISGSANETSSASSTVLSRSVPNFSIAAAINNPGIYDSTSNRTFIAYLGIDRNLYVVFIDHSTGEVSAPVLAANYPIDPQDDHGAPSIAIDGTGYLHVMFGSHNTSAIHAKSTSPRDITSWTASTLSSLPAVTYTSLVFEPATGNLYAPFRAGNVHGSSYPAHEFAGMLRSTDGGDTWTDVGPIIDLSGHPAAFKDVYGLCASVHEGKVYLSWQIAYGSKHDDVRANAYVACFDPVTLTWSALDDTNLGASITWADHTGAVVVREKDNMNLPRHIVGATGDVHLIWTEYDSVLEACKVMHASWSGTQWVSSDTGARTHHNAHSPALRMSQEGELEAFCITSNHASVVYDNDVTADFYETFGGDLTKWVRSSEGGPWAKEKQIASRHSVGGNGVGTVIVPQSSSPGAKAVYCAGQGGNAGFNLPLYFYSEDSVNYVQAASRKPNTQACYSYQLVAQTFQPGVFDKVLMETEQFDELGAWDVALSRFTPTRPGYYLITVGFGMSYLVTDTVGTRIVFRVTKNAALYASLATFNAVSGGTTASTTGSCLVFMDGISDYLEIEARHDFADPKDSSPGAHLTFFQAVPI